MSLNDEPLSDEEFDELDDFLLSERCPDDAMTMDTLHGFLTAIVIGPGAVAMSEWLPHVWGVGGALQFASDQEQERITELILRFMQEIALIFDVAPKDYEPLFCEHEWRGKTLLDAEAWAMGFWTGINLRPTAWTPIWSSDKAALMQPIYLLGAEELDEVEEKLVNDPLKRHKLAVEVEANIPAIRRFWTEYGKAVTKTESPVDPGMSNGNGPCACGSGKRFRQCCGTEPILH